MYATSRKLETMKGFTQPHIKTKALDVCDDDAVNRVSSEIIKEAGRIDIVVRVAVNPTSSSHPFFQVSNAGFMEVGSSFRIIPHTRPLISHTGAVLDMPPARAQAMFDTNTFGTLRLARATIPHMASRKSGLFLIIGSVGGVIPTPWTGYVLVCDSYSSVSTTTGRTQRVKPRYTPSPKASRWNADL